MSGLSTAPAGTLDGPDELTTPRLLLRLAGVDDADAVAYLANDRHIAEMTARIPHPYGRSDAIAFLGGDRTEIIRAVTRLSDGVLMGLTGLQPRPGRKRFELGYWLGRPFWGQGFGTEAAQAMIDHAFADLAAEIVEIRCRVVNGASRRIVHKCGFQFAGTGMDVSLAAGRVASESYRMDRSCWQSLKSWGGR